LDYVAWFYLPNPPREEEDDELGVDEREELDGENVVGALGREGGGENVVGLDATDASDRVGELGGE
jgi:hypothetical protein